MPDLEMTVATEPEALFALTATSTYPDPSPRGREQRSAFRARFEAADPAWSLEQAIRAVQQVATVEMNDAIVGLVVAREVTVSLLTGAMSAPDLLSLTKARRAASNMLSKDKGRGFSIAMIRKHWKRFGPAGPIRLAARMWTKYPSFLDAAIIATHIANIIEAAKTCHLGSRICPEGYFWRLPQSLWEQVQLRIAATGLGDRALLEAMLKGDLDEAKRLANINYTKTS